MTSFGTNQDYNDFINKYGKDPLLKKLGIGGSKSKNYLGVGVITAKSLAVAPFPLGGAGKWYGGGSSGGSGAPTKVFKDLGTKTPPGSTTHQSAQLNIHAYTPRDIGDPETVEAWMVMWETFKESHPEFLEMIQNEAAIEFLSFLVEQGVGMSGQTLSFLTMVFDTTNDTSKKQDLLATSHTKIINSNGDIIGYSTIMKLGDGSESHVILRSDGTVFSFEDNTTPESRQISIWEFRDSLKDEESTQTKTEDSEESDSSGATETEEENSNENENEDEEEQETPALRLTYSDSEGEVRFTAQETEDVVFMIA
ncbi:hypothetical protein [Ruegeria sp. HKCCE3926]|uniref:hypothetical protein n=1 Tax=Ruegeria sp. HKCCE3926 TaxID=2794831 RepID=UPI001AE38D2A|nr:hypothetical protein [Ruegeria sp. HKCCE3926]